MFLFKEKQPQTNIPTLEWKLLSIHSVACTVSDVCVQTWESLNNSAWVMRKVRLR